MDSGEQLTLSGAVETELGPGDPARAARLQRPVLELYPADPAFLLPALHPAQPAVALQRVPADGQVERPGQVWEHAGGEGRQQVVVQPHLQSITINVNITIMLFFHKHINNAPYNSAHSLICMSYWR